MDLNRAGTPLLEIVTEPDLSSPQDVALFGQELQKIVQFLGVSHAQMQMGQMRFEPNINVHITDQDGVVHKTAITEIKNLNCFSVLERATAYEIQRQIRQWEETGSLGRKSTTVGTKRPARRFRSGKRRRPTITAISPTPTWFRWKWTRRGWRKSRPKSANCPPPGESDMSRPWVYRRRMRRSWRATCATGEFYEAAIAAGGDAKRVSNLILSHGRRLANEKSVALSEIGVSARRFAEVAKLIDQNKISASSAGAIFDKLRESDRPVEQLAADLGLTQVSDTGAIDAAIDAVIAENPKPLQDYRAGKQSAMVHWWAW